MAVFRKPEYVLRPEGIIKNIFLVEKDIAKRIINKYDIASLLENEQHINFFGTITQDGILQIWNLGAFCRSVLSIPTNLQNCSWANVTIITDNINFLVYSRQSGLYVGIMSNGNTRNISFNPQQIRSLYAGFYQPIFHSNIGEIIVINSENDLVRIHLPSNSGQLIRLDGITHITFLIGFEKDVNLILLGSENGKVLLLNVSTPDPIICDEVDLLKNQLVEKRKKKSGISADENIAIPLCCSGDEVTSNYLIGTRANVLILVSIETLVDLPEIRLSKCIGIPNPGVNSIILNPKKDAALVAGWDGKVRIFTFPSMNFIQLIEWNMYPKISVVSFIEKQIGSIPKPYLLLAPNVDVLSVWNFDISKAVEPINL